MNLLAYGLVALAIIGALSGIGYKIHDAGYKAAKLECEEAARKLKAEEEKQAADASSKLEKDNAKAKVVYRTITKTVDKYIDRPIYRNVCLDADGLRDANAALSGALTPAGEPNKPLPKPSTP
jgi:hypothetical protein